LQNLPPQLLRLQRVWPKGPGAPRLTGGGTKDVYFDRWTSVSDDPFELILDFDVEDYVLSLPLTSSKVVYNIGRKLITNNEIYPGEPFLNGPVSATSRKVYRSTFDVFRVNISADFLRERASCATGRNTQYSPGLLFGPNLNTDPILQALLLAAATGSTPQDNLYIESIGIAIAEYLLRRYNALKTTRRISPLPKWRLACITEYIDANFGRDIYLADLGALVGVSRMHFAAQFKAATGVSPHAYILRRRIRAARTLLLTRTLTIEAVALSVGFRSPAHFADVFHRLVGEPPSRWRDMIIQSRGETLGRDSLPNDG